MKVTDKEYSLEEKLVEKLDLMCDRCTKREMDNWIVIDGDEGLGKSNLSIAIGYYFAWKLKRSFSIDNVYFNIDKLIEDAKSSKEQVFIWDEAALGGLAQEWFTKSQKKLIKLAMIVRKKKHIFILNIPKFFKLQEYLIVDRSVALIHVYARNNIEIGRFIYYTKKIKEMLYNEWKVSKKRSYKKYSRSGVRGTFPKVLGLVINEDEYELKKDEAISGFDTKEEMSREQKRILLLEYKVYKFIQVLKSKGMNIKESCINLGVAQRTIDKWGLIKQKNPFLLEEYDEELASSPQLCKRVLLKGDTPTP